jgi:hypothetical protein
VDADANEDENRRLNNFISFLFVCLSCVPLLNPFLLLYNLNNTAPTEPSERARKLNTLMLQWPQPSRTSWELMLQVTHQFSALLLSTAVLLCPGPFLTTESRATSPEHWWCTCTHTCMHAHRQCIAINTLLLSTALFSCPGPFLTTESRATIHEPMLQTCGAQCTHARTHTRPQTTRCHQHMHMLQTMTACMHARMHTNHVLSSRHAHRGITMSHM